MSKKLLKTSLVVCFMVLLIGCPCLKVTLIKVVESGTEGIISKVLCADPVVFPLTAGRTIDVGTLTVSNDTDYVYVTFDTSAGDWVLKTTHVHAGWDLDDVERASSGKPIPGQFAYGNERSEGEAVVEDTILIPIPELPEDGECGDLLYVWAHAEVCLTEDGGAIIQEESAWGGDIFDQDSAAWYYYLTTELVCCDGISVPGGLDDELEGEFGLRGQGGWGTNCHGHNPGCYRDNNIASIDPAYLTVGCGTGYTLTFTTSSAIAAFLPTGGTAGALAQSYTDPADGTEAGSFAGQVLALSLNLGFDAVDPDFTSGDDWVGDLMVCDTGTVLDGWLLWQVLEEANKVLGGCTGDTGLTAGELAELLSYINEGFYLCASV